MSKQLIIYFSRKGNNYVGGEIVNLERGNTDIAANMIYEITQGDLFQIETVTPYSQDYMTCTEEAKKELQENARPQIISPPASIDEYETIFVGYPNWWGTMPMAVFTFLESYHLADKVIIPFCTHEGSGMGSSEQDLKAICPQAILRRGLAIYGSEVAEAKPEIETWVRKSLQ